MLFCLFKWPGERDCCFTFLKVLSVLEVTWVPQATWPVKARPFFKTLLKIDLKSIPNLLEICLLICNVK